MEDQHAFPPPSSVLRRLLYGRLSSGPLALWRDRRGRVSVLRIAVLITLVFPLGLALATAWSVGLGARPVNDLIHRAGYWALMFLLLSLAITTLRRVARFGALVDVRRMIGVGAFCYAVAHLGLFVVDQKLDLLKVATEIVSRVYLTIGFAVFCGLMALAATSTDGMVRRLGGLRWRRLHQIIYVLALFALVHFFQQTKADVTVPTLFAGLFAWLMVYRIVAALRRERTELPAWALLAVTIVVAGLTFLGEAVGIGIAYHVSPLTVLEGAFDFDLAIRPGWYVLAAGLVVVAVDLVRSRWRRLSEMLRARRSGALVVGRATET
jgi:sulfoxide reductase heme-binding subunit YedZ